MNDDKDCRQASSNCQAWLKALQDYLNKAEKGKDYRSFLIEALLQDRIAVEQADWILERIGELPFDLDCSCPHPSSVSSSLREEKSSCGCQTKGDT